VNDILEIERAGAGEKGPLRLWLRLLATANLIAGELGARLKARHGISLAQFDYLAQLHRSGAADVAMSELGRRLMVTSGNVTGLTDRLERQGWVRRERASHDRRTQFVRLTADGRARFEAIAAEHRQWVQELMAGLDADARRVLFTLLGQLKQSVLEGAGRKTPEAAA
jgi:DNA-binding MarR family transcriptional regulator